MCEMQMFPTVWSAQTVILVKCCVAGCISSKILPAIFTKIISRLVVIYFSLFKTILYSPSSNHNT